ncbi:MAG: RNA methyltransferase, partial [Deltaproteobacteria bacterium]|nr:RNA methyltransferase [Deltaproteobacteria bacterium]
MPTLTTHWPLDHITIVLQEPRYPENIGSTARAAWNMGLSHLIAVNPEDPDRERMNRLATHMAAGLLERMPIALSLEGALAPFQYVIGTTARLGGERRELISPAEAAQTIKSLGPANRIALLFGPEDRGLSNEELRFCQATVNIPTATAGSLNLAQAVLILGYEIFLAHRSEIRSKVRPEEAGWSETRAIEIKRSFRNPSLATSLELEGMYAHLEEALQMMDFLDRHNPGHWMMSIRRFLSRIQLYSHEV